MRRTKRECPICGREISRSNYQKHIDKHNRKPNLPEIPKYRLMHEGLVCQFCGRLCINRNSLCNHERLCKNDPNRQLINYAHTSQKGRKAWNKGLKKETSPKILQISNSLKEYYKVHPGSFSGRHHTKESIEKISKSGGFRKNSGIGKKGYYKGVYCASTYELAFVIYNIDHNIKFERFKGYYLYSYNGKKHKYFPDFILEDGSLVEIKGYATDLVNIKLMAVKDRKITVLYKSDLKYAFDYIKEKYGKNETNLFELYE